MILSQRQFEVLRAIYDQRDGGRFGDGWCRPMDIGAHSGSDHSHMLTKLAGMGYVEQRGRGLSAYHHTRGARGSKEYRITDVGVKKLEEIRADYERVAR